MVEYAKRGTDKIQKGIVRIGKIVPRPLSESAGEMKEWSHAKRILRKLERARATTTRKMEDITDQEGGAFVSSLQTLLDIFSGVKLLLPVSVQDFHRLRCYFVVYDRDIVEDCDSSSAAHALTEPEENSRVQRVTPSWIWESSLPVNDKQ